MTKILASRRGSALVYVVIVAAVIIIFSAVMAGVSVTNMRLARNVGEFEQAFYTAEMAALTAAYAFLDELEAGRGFVLLIDIFDENSFNFDDLGFNWIYLNISESYGAQYLSHVGFSVTKSAGGRNVELGMDLIARLENVGGVLTYRIVYYYMVVFEVR